MKLFIDTSDAEKIVVGLDGQMHEREAKKEKSQLLLPFVDELLKEKGKTPKDLTEIEVNLGPGSFTGLRVGLSIANTLSWSLGIPLNGQDVKKAGPVLPVYN